MSSVWFLKLHQNLVFYIFTFMYFKDNFKARKWEIKVKLKRERMRAYEKLFLYSVPLRANLYLTEQWFCVYILLWINRRCLFLFPEGNYVTLDLENRQSLPIWSRIVKKRMDFHFGRLCREQISLLKNHIWTCKIKGRFMSTWLCVDRFS
jgi:hypothetical protein